VTTPVGAAGSFASPYTSPPVHVRRIVMSLALASALAPGCGSDADIDSAGDSTTAPAVALNRPAPFGMVRHPLQAETTTVGERWIASPDRLYESRLIYSFPHPDLADLVLPTVDLVVATLAWGDES